MFYAYTSAGETVRFAAFGTQAEANEWLVEEVGSDYSDRLWIAENGDLRRDSKWFPDFGAEVYPSLETAIEAFAGLDADAAIRVIRELLNVAEIAEAEEA